VSVRFNLACSDISSLMSKESFFLEVLLSEIEVNEDLLNMMNVIEEDELF
jgi:hypothetical protein